ncbi:MAG TPA: GNAT family N-acetyltransferase [Pirellulales bacterium]|nr:GNAT family N-acetyltransferase [Pirellulales bacterium]
MRYRRASIDDAMLLAEMNFRLIRDEGHRNPMTVGQLTQRMSGWLRDEYQAVLFEDEQGVAGYALYKPEPDWTNLRQFFVEPARRRQGVGRAAIAWLLQNAWKDSPRIRVEVLIGNLPGIEFWRAVGFVDYSLTLEYEC